MKKLRNISEIRRYFHRNETPIYFVSATNFNLLGISEWVRNFRYINYIDCFDGRHPSVFIPSEAPHREFESIEDIVNYLLEHKETIDFVKARGDDPKAVFLMFDEKTEALCEEIGLDVWFPPAELRSRVDNKIETVRIGNRAGVPSVPNVLARIDSYATLQEVAGEAGLGDDLVLQSAFGDSGNTTWFIASENDYRKYADKIEDEPEIKVMKRVNVRGSAI
ncbi:MAG: biotin carboxylase, partial [Gammaproteobacteria bacterium]|nr:biotin carboxylase [Gammaproteobacteria bacterium]